MIRCLHCGAETSNGLALCDLCRRAVLVSLEFIPVYFRNLARWRPGSAGTRQVPGSREPQAVSLAGSDAVTQALDDAGADLSTWVQILVEDRPGLVSPTTQDTEADTVSAICAFLTEHIVSASTLDWIGRFATSTREWEAYLRSFTMRVAPGWYAGACRQCQTPTHVVPGLTWVTCGACGATTHAAAHLEDILSEARAWIARPRHIAEAVVALVDTEESVPRLYERIKKWEQRERLDGIRRIDADGDAVGPKRYRLGDVLDLIQSDGATRSARTSARAS